MSRIGEMPIIIAQGVTVEKTDSRLVVNGPKGNLQLDINPNIEVEVKEGQILVKRKGEAGKDKALHGLSRSLIANMVVGVTEGWSKDLELQGVGFRAQSSGDKLTLVIGFSHPVEIQAPQGVSFEVTDNTKIKILGIDKATVGQLAATIRKIRPPDVYKGKGIRYQGEYVRRKAGKAGKVGAGAAK